MKKEEHKKDCEFYSKITSKFSCTCNDSPTKNPLDMTFAEIEEKEKYGIATNVTEKSGGGAGNDATTPPEWVKEFRGLLCSQCDLDEPHKLKNCHAVGYGHVKSFIENLLSRQQEAIRAEIKKISPREYDAYLRDGIIAAIDEILSLPILKKKEK